MARKPQDHCVQWDGAIGMPRVWSGVQAGKCLSRQQGALSMGKHKGRVDRALGPRKVLCGAGASQSKTVGLEAALGSAGSFFSAL